jgi:hypothetical protein
MRIISWNCNMAYATKQEDALALHPDVLLLQECSEKHIRGRTQIRAILCRREILGVVPADFAGAKAASLT